MDRKKADVCTMFVQSEHGQGFLNSKNPCNALVTRVLTGAGDGTRTRNLLITSWF